MDQTHPKPETTHIESYKKRLNFHVPILSIKGRPAASVDDNDHQPSKDTSRIPFSWEQSPGKPKKIGKNYDSTEAESETPRPRLPPARWHQTVTDDHDGREAIDMMSLSEAINFIERSEKIQGPERVDSDTDGSGEIYYRHSPNFIMERFLPDASALASASRDVIAEFPYDEVGTMRKRRYVSSSCSSRRGCGMEVLLFPWRMKHKICGVKTPIVTVATPRSCGVVVHKEKKRSPVCFVGVNKYN